MSSRENVALPKGPVTQPEATAVISDKVDVSSDHCNSWTTYGLRCLNPN